jgi:hypothetical protein
VLVCASGKAARGVHTQRTRAPQHVRQARALCSAPVEARLQRRLARGSSGSERLQLPHGLLLRVHLCVARAVLGAGGIDSERQCAWHLAAA